MIHPTKEKAMQLAQKECMDTVEIMWNDNSGASTEEDYMHITLLGA